MKRATPSTPRREAFVIPRWIGQALLAAFIASAETVLTASHPAVAQAPGLAPTEAPKALVTVEAIVTGRSGASQAAGARRFKRLSAGERMDADLTAGMPDTPEFCLPGAQASDEMRRRALWWHVDVGVREVVGNRVALDIGWTRAVAPGAPVEGDARSVVLQFDQDHVIDFVSSAPSGAAPCANLVVRVRAAPTPPPRTAAWLDYDVWLVEQVAGQRVTRRHTRIEAQAGEVTAYRFAPVDLARSAVFVDVYGSLRSDGQADGSFALNLEARRDVRTTLGTTGGLGRLAWVARPGETVEVPLPLPKEPVDGGSATAGRVFALLIRVDYSR